MPSCWGSGRLGLADEAGAFSLVANYPFTLLNGNSSALFFQGFINPVAASLREVTGGKFPPINILYESRRRVLQWVQRGGCGHRGITILGVMWNWGPLQPVLTVLAELVLDVHALRGWWDSRFAPFPLPLLCGQDAGNTLGCWLGRLFNKKANFKQIFLFFGHFLAAKNQECFSCWFCSTSVTFSASPIHLFPIFPIFCGSQR